MYEEIIYRPEDAVPLASNNHEAIVIEVITCNFKLEDRQLVPVRTPLIGFAGPPVRPEGMITLQVTVGVSPRCRTIPVKFAVVKEPSSYNMILGRPTLNALRAVCSTLHLSMKFPTSDGVAEVLGDPEVARACYIATLKGKEKLVAQTICLESWEPLERGERLETDEGLAELPVQPDRPEHTVKVGAGLGEQIRSSLESLLEEYAEIFAWSADDMPGIPTELAVHRLHVDPNVRPVKQKKRNFAPERKEVFKSEVGKLLEAKIVKEVYYPTWLANPVLVKKEEKAWRMCVDFTDLNKACPKDCYPLPRIDQLVDSTAGYEIFCFLDAFKGYHQIALDEGDQEKTSFITEDGTYCYVTMPFGLKNAGATYQRLVNKLFRNQIGRNLEVYVDDMLVKSRTQEQFVSDLREIFEILRSSRMRLNPKKCTFGVRSGKFLGYMISKEGVRANPDKIKAIMDMAPPRNIKEVQRLTGRMAALNRFLSKSAVRGAPFFKALKANRQFEWSLECQRAFDELKAHLARLPALTSPELGETLFIYLAAGEGAISAVLVREEERTQKPVYYVSRALQGAEARYSAVERYVLALVHAARKLRTYFQAHPVVVITDQPLKQILSKPESSGRMVNWAVELSEYDLGYQPRTSIKAQALADFIADGVSFGSPEAEDNQASDVQARRDMGVGKEVPAGQAAKALPAHETTKAVQAQEAAEVLQAEDVAEITQVTQVAERGPSGEAAEAQQAGEAAEDRPSREADETQQVKKAVKDRQAGEAVEAEQTQGTAKVGEAEEAAKVGQAADADEAGHLGKADKAKLAGDTIQARKDAEAVERAGPTWTLYVDGASSKEGCGAGLLLISPTGEELPYALRFDFRASNNESEYEALIAGMEITRKLGARSIKIYSDSQLIVNQIPRSQNRRDDALSKLASTSAGGIGREILVEMVKSRAYDQVSTAVIQVVSSWMDPVIQYLAQGELPPDRTEARKILLKSQRTLVSDNGRQFADQSLREWCTELGIQQHFTLVGHPQANGQVENVNRTILHGLRTRLESVRTSWLEELPTILWAYRTTPRTATQETPFVLTYGVEAVIPAEVGVPSGRVQHFVAQDNDEEMRLNLDLVEHRREEATIRMAKYKGQVARYYNARVKRISFKPGDLVLRKNSVSRAVGTGKLDPNWEGPYVVKEADRAGYCRLARQDGSEVPRTWHNSNLKLFL
ncbi:uncharacterized protein [Coffea arabica]|uniref:Uncharacterized protein n=1 Tax=Coffea arabica TaxID=13443 RepID=A0ABM4UY18_COFAR